jgi:hypothetical protein
MAGNVVRLRDFKRREEREAADVRLAKQAEDTAPCELPGVCWIEGGASLHSRSMGDGEGGAIQLVHKIERVIVQPSNQDG